MVNSKLGSLETLTWKEGREMLKEVNPLLTDIIDYINPNSDYVLFRAKYPFGAKILDKGIFNLPPNGKPMPTNNTDFLSDIKDKLSYSRIPIGIVIKNACEVYFEPEGRTAPLSLINKGNMFGLWEAFDPTLSGLVSRVEWSMVSGARSIFMLPKISDASSYKKLIIRYGLRTDLPKTLFDQGLVFTEICNKACDISCWNTEIIFFSSKWIEKLNEPSWIGLSHFLLKLAWDQSQYWRSKAVFDLTWESFLSVVYKRVKCKPYHVDTVKHLVTVATSGLPGFSIAEDDTVAPIKFLQETYINEYGIKKYAPIIMQPCGFYSLPNKASLYYSLQWPTLIEYYPVRTTLSNIRSIISDLRDIKLLMKILVDKLQADNSPIYDQIKDIGFEYFHTAQDDYGEILSSKEIPARDKSLEKTINHDFPNLIFPDASPFFNGCIRIFKYRNK